MNHDTDEELQRSLDSQSSSGRSHLWRNYLLGCFAAPLGWGMSAAIGWSFFWIATVAMLAGAIVIGRAHRGFLGGFLTGGLLGVAAVVLMFSTSHGHW